MDQNKEPKKVMINISGDSLESSFQQVVTVPGQLNNLPDHPLHGHQMTPNANRMQRELHRQNREHNENNGGLEIENLLSSQI